MVEKTDALLLGGPAPHPIKVYLSSVANVMWGFRWHDYFLLVV